MTFSPITPAILEQLRAIVGPENLIYDEPERMADYARDETVAAGPDVHMPEVVVKPARADEIAAIMKLANRERVPVTPRGAGSGLSGGAVPLSGGILLSFDRMNRILEIDRKNLVAIVEPGVITNDINEAVREYGLFYAGYPMSREMCSIGGNVAENAGGGRAIKYGVTGRYVLGLEAVLPTGEVVRMGGKRVKDVTGYDLIHLLVGSEGTLAIVTQITLRLVPLPAARLTLLAAFTSVKAAIDVVPQVMTVGRLVPSAIEFMDCNAVARGYEWIEERAPHPDICAALLFEVDGSSQDEVQAQAEAIVDICMTAGALDVYVGDTPASQRKMWYMREKLAEGLTVRFPVQSAEDIVVPPAQIPDLLGQMEEFGRTHGAEVIAYGHAGDGNLHLRIIPPAGTTLDQWQANAQTRAGDLYGRVARLGGTISAEHGIGYKLSRYLPLVLDPALIELQKRIKQAFDPNGILNPGKIFP